jgi:hypothetical protein
MSGTINIKVFARIFQIIFDVDPILKMALKAVLGFQERTDKHCENEYKFFLCN